MDPLKTDHGSSEQSNEMDPKPLNLSAKNLSISSIESLSSDVATQPSIAKNQISMSGQVDEYNYVKAGAKPKTSKKQSGVVAGASTSTSCSSLSSQTTSSSSGQRRNKTSFPPPPPPPPTTDIILMDQESVRPQTKCPLCLRSVEGIDLENHFQLEHREYECPFCGLLFDNEFSMSQHLVSVHNESNEFMNFGSSGQFPVRDVDIFEASPDRFRILYPFISGLKSHLVNYKGVRNSRAQFVI